MSKAVNELTGISMEKANEINKKKAELDASRTELQHRQLLEKRREREAIDNIDLGEYDEEHALKVAKETREYLMAARNSKHFINDSFRGKVPFFPRNIVLAVAETGSGKSTISANLTFSAITQGQKVLVISNEENDGDIYNRITCLIHGWPYSDHENFTDAQLDEFERMTPILSRRLTVVTDNYKGIANCTTSIEGVERILNSVLVKDSKIDLIIVDYYQNIDKSVDNPDLADWQVQYRFAKFLDQYKNRSKSTIVVLAQKKGGNGKDLSFKESIEGRKSILNVATCALNVVADKENYATAFEIKKSRFNDCMGEVVKVGWEKGKYVPYSTEFRQKAMMAKDAKDQAQLMSKVNPKGFGSEET